MLSPEAEVVPPRPAADSDGTIYVLLPVHNRRSVTEKFVGCLAGQTDRRFHLVLIDDGSTDGTAQAVIAILPTTTVLRGSGSWWWAGSLQRGYRWLSRRQLSARDIVLIANDDTGFDADFLARARAALAGSRRALLLAQLYSKDSGEYVESGVHVDWSRLTFTGVSELSQVNCLSTRGLFLFARDFIELGGFHPHLLPHYGSDYEFTIRAQRKGFQLRSVPAVKLWYDEFTTGIRSVSTASIRDYLRTTLSRRSVANPIYWTTFLLLSCPHSYLPRNLVRVWRGFIAGMWSARRTVR